MKQDNNSLNVLHSFPHRLGMSRICTTAWHEIDSVANTGANLFVVTGDLTRPFHRQNIKVKKTFRPVNIKLPYRILGAKRMCYIHDWLVSKNLHKFPKIDIIHTWPLASLRTTKVAKQLGIPVALERCNAHTRFAYNCVQEECERLGVKLPKGHEHAFNAELLEREEKEYKAADGILCPSDFVVKTYLDEGYRHEKLKRFIYGVDEKLFYPSRSFEISNSKFTMIYVGVAAVRKGLHFALEAWTKSKASETGEFLVVGDFVPEYENNLSALLSHPSVKVLGHRNDVPQLMRKANIFTLPSIEEGFGLVCTEAMASGCVPLVSNACTDLCKHMENSMVHQVGQVEEIVEHIDKLYSDRELLNKLRDRGLSDVPSLTWTAAGNSILKAYREIISSYNHYSKG